MDYNGWKNRETWLISVWFEPQTVEDVESAKEHFEEEFDKLPPFMKDFVDSSSIDWDELRAQFDEEDLEYDDSMDGDFDSAMSSAGWGTDEDYGCYGGDE